MRIATYNAEKMGQCNKKIVLNMIRFHPGISRRDLAETVGLDPSTVTKIIRDLQLRGWVREVGCDGHLQPGRPAIKLEVVKETAVALAVEMSVKRNCFALGYLDNDIDKESFFSFQTPPEKSVKAYFDALAAHVSSRLTPETLRKLDAICVAVPGTVEKESNVLRYVPHMQWHGVDLESELRLRLPCIDNCGVEILAVNKAKLGLLAEKTLNREIGNMKNGVYLYISQGVGGALMFDEKIYHGSNNTAGEIGRMTVGSGCGPCGRGVAGCLEAYVSIEFMVEAYEKRYGVLGGDISDRFDALMKMGEALDPKTDAVFDEIRDYLVIGIGNIVNALDPDFVMIGGMGARFPDRFIEKIGEGVYGQLLYPREGSPRILKGSTDVDALILRGATLIAMDGFVEKLFAAEEGETDR